MQAKCVCGNVHAEPENPFKIGDLLAGKDLQEHFASTFSESSFPETLTVEAVGHDWVLARGGYLMTPYMLAWEALKARDHKWAKAARKRWTKSK